jgi:hypothetical protein
VNGRGYWGKNHVRNMKILGAIAAVCDATDAERKLATKLASDVLT